MKQIGRSPTFGSLSLSLTRASYHHAVSLPLSASFPAFSLSSSLHLLALSLALSLCSFANFLSFIFFFLFERHCRLQSLSSDWNLFQIKSSTLFFFFLFLEVKRSHYKYLSFPVFIPVFHQLNSLNSLKEKEQLQFVSSN